MDDALFFAKVFLWLLFAMTVISFAGFCYCFWRFVWSDRNV